MTCDDADDEDGELVPRSREDTIAEGLRLGLPRAWLEKLPEIDELPGDYGEARDDGDAFLVWKAQEHLVRTGRLAEADPAAVAEALEDEAANDGPRWLFKAQERLMFLMAWPRRTYHLKTEVDLAADHLRGCLQCSPSMWLLVEESWSSSWSLARYQAEGLDDTLDLPETCPWPSLEDLLRAAEERLEADRRRFP